MKFTALAAALLAMIAANTSAAPPDPAAQANAGTVRVITGMAGGTYLQTAADLMILDNGTLRVLPILGKGSLSNMSDILYLQGVDIGFVQADAQIYAQQHGLFPGRLQDVRYIAKLYDEEMHILVGPDIHRIEDLGGKHVNVDITGSGSAMTAEIVLTLLGVDAIVDHDRQIDGIEKLKSGQIAGIIHVGGAPIPLIAGVPAGSGLHFLSVALTDTLAKTYLPGELSHDEYPTLIPDATIVPTIAVPDVMAVFNWQPGTERYKKCAAFVDAFFSRFGDFQQRPRHPKWREVSLVATVPGWQRFPPAEKWLVEHAAGAGTAVRQQFDQFIDASNAKPAGSEMDRDALFAAFLKWRQQVAPLQQ
jgi:uncharacterized protein